MFQDSSLAIEAFMKNIDKAQKMKELQMVKTVVDLVDFEFEPILMIIGTFTDLHTLKMPGLKQIDIETESMDEFLHLLQNNCLKLQVRTAASLIFRAKGCVILVQMFCINKVA
jgi:hypothetical protein